MLRAVLNGGLESVAFQEDPVFGVQTPQTCPDVPPDVLQPRRTWQDQRAYDEQAKKLAGMFARNFKQFADHVPQDVRMAGPRVTS